MAWCSECPYNNQKGRWVRSHATIHINHIGQVSKTFLPHLEYMAQNPPRQRVQQPPTQTPPPPPTLVRQTPPVINNLNDPRLQTAQFQSYLAVFLEQNPITDQHTGLEGES